VRTAGANDAEILEIVMNVAAATFTNYLNVVAQTDLDLPAVSNG
jgi:alkylhydroperoxidase family enzyme